MSLERRFVITGHAVGVGGVVKRIGDRPVGKALPVHGVSVVPGAGGIAKSSKDSSTGKLVSYARCSSTTSAIPDSRGVYQINIWADVSQFLASQPQPEFSFSARRLRVDVLASASPDAYPNSGFAVKSVAVKSDRMVFGGKPVTVNWDPSLLLPASTSQRSDYDTFSIARSIRWGTETRDGHMLRLEGFGSIHFGEVFREESGFRLTLVRLDMGSDTEADVSVADVRPGGEWMP